MKTIFDPATLGNLRLRNRVVRSATLEAGYAKDGTTVPELADVYGELARAGVGLIITGMMGVGKNSCFTPSMTKIYGDGFAANFRRLADAVHTNGGKLVVQLGQCGAKANQIDDGAFPYAPSDFQLKDAQAKAMTAAQIARVIEDFAASALKCKENGADGVQIHGAHGYLLSQFLSPYFNKRTDEFGGSLENRAHIVLAVYDAVRDRVGPGYPVLIKINSSDLVDGGMTEDECAWVCGQLSAKGIDAIEISGGIGVSAASAAARPAGKEGYFADAALRIASAIDAAVISVGGYRTVVGMEEVLNKGRIEAIALCRPFIKEPGLVAKWREERAAKAVCISCNKCYGVAKLGCPVA